MKKKTTDEFIEECKELNNFYQYHKVEYINSKEKVTIECPTHGEFHIAPNHFLRGSGCPKCSNNYKYNTKEFIIKAKEIHGNKYDYTKVEYKSSKEYIDIACKVHGSFKQTPNSHLLGHGCKKCNTSNIKRDYVKYFYDKCRKKNRNKYSYDNIKFDENDNLLLECKKHGTFSVSQEAHLRGNGCVKCKDELKKKKKKDISKTFFKNVKLKHSNKYTYDETSYKRSDSLIVIYCPIHGEFKQKANSHLNGSGCSKCVGNNKKDTDYFIDECNKKHNYKYTYEKCVYKGANINVIITCPKHGDFIQKATSHLNYNGCPKCTQSKGENIVESYLIKNNINYKTQHKFDDCKNKTHLKFDFFLYEKNICIEYDGVQHYKAVKRFGGMKSLKQTQINDSIKNDYCKKNNIVMMRIKYDEDVYSILDNFFKTYTEKDVQVYTPFQETVYNINTFMTNRKKYKWSKLIGEIKHHYKTDKHAYSSLRKYIKNRVIKGYKLTKEDKSVFLIKL